MGKLLSRWREFKFILALPEVHPFWLFIPFLAVIAALGAFFLDSITAFFITGLGVLVGMLIFFYSSRTARANYEMKAELLQMQNIIMSLSDAIIVYDKDFRVLFWNPAAESIFRLEAKTVMGHKVTPQDGQNDAWRLLVQVIFPSLAPVMVSQTESGTYPQITDLAFEEPLLHLRVITAPVAGETTRTLRFIKIIRDRTREVLIMKSKNDFITVASHQLRGPVTNIGWALETLKSDKNLDESSRSVVESATSANQEMLSIIEDLLKVSKIEEGRFGYNFEPVDILRFVEKIVGEFLPQARQLGVKVYLDRPSEPLPQVFADGEKLRMVLENLMDNAMRYNVQGGEITVKIKQSEEKPFMEISVKDTGIGISPLDLEKIFSKFYRADNAMKYKTEGSGLGLYIAKNIIRSHGGQMWAESELDRGSVFYLTLPTDKKLVPAKEVPLEY